MSIFHTIRMNLRQIGVFITVGLVCAAIGLGAGELLWHPQRGTKPDYDEAANSYVRDCKRRHSPPVCDRIQQNHHRDCWNGAITYVQCGPGGGYCQDVDLDRYRRCMRAHEPTATQSASHVRPAYLVLVDRGRAGLCTSCGWYASRPSPDPYPPTPAPPRTPDAAT